MFQVVIVKVVVVPVAMQSRCFVTNVVTIVEVTIDVDIVSFIVIELAIVTPDVVVSRLVAGRLTNSGDSN